MLPLFPKKEKSKLPKTVIKGGSQKRNRTEREAKRKCRKKNGNETVIERKKERRGAKQADDKPEQQGPHGKRKAEEGDER